MTEFSNHILIADDDESVRGVLAEVLADEGYSVVEAADGEEALALFRDNPCRVVITDIRMPGVDGITLLEEIRKIDERTQVVIMTSHASMETSIKALKLGAYDYIIKPFESIHLISQVAKRARDAVQLAEERDLLVASLTRNNQELERLNKFFRELAIRDGLTGLHNHRYFQESLKAEVKRALRYGRELSLIFLDVDHFKQYNDTNGHQQGDELLKELAALLASSIRSVDTAARWGGEEFVVMAPETTLESCRQMAELIRDRVASHSFKGADSQPGGRVTISAGIATLVADSDDRQLVYLADQALYEAKNSGRNCVRVASPAKKPQKDPQEAV